MKKMLFASLLGAAMASAATAVPVQYEVDLTGVAYTYDGVVISSTVAPEAANAQVLYLGWSDVEADVYHNPGAVWENWGMEAFIGAWMEDSAAPGFDYYGGYPFPDDLGPTGGEGSVLHLGPASNEFDLTGGAYFLDEFGTIEFFARTTYDDGTGMPAGQFTAGTLYMVVDIIPAPGAFALFGAAGLVAGRRRR